MISEIFLASEDRVISLGLGVCAREVATRWIYNHIPYSRTDQLPKEPFFKDLKLAHLQVKDVETLKWVV
jgi:hypothetical protein